MKDAHAKKQPLVKKFQKNIWNLLGIFLVVLCILVTLVATNRNFSAWAVLGQLHLPRVAAILDPNDATLQFEIGNYYFGGSREYNVERAEEFFRRTIALNPSYPVAHYQLGRTLFIQGKMYAAERELDQELEIHPDFWKSYYVRGLIRGYAGNLSGAAKDFQEFLRHKPESWAAHNDLAWVYFQLGKYKKTRNTILEGLTSSPDNPWLNNSLGVALLNLGDTEGARTALLRAKVAVEQMTPESWGRAYPGNNPIIYGQGLDAMRTSIRENLTLLEDASTAP